MSGAGRRFASVDALRGLTVAAMLLVNNPGDWGHVYAPLQHAAWNGCTPTDLVFPFFLFIVGVSIALGLVPKREAAAATAALDRDVLVRALRIVGLGLGLHLCAWLLLDLAHFRPWGVLQRIGLCFLAAGLAAIHLRAVGQWACAAALLAGYALLLAATGGTAPFDNIVDRVDAALLGPHLYVFDAASGRGHDPEGLLSTLPAIATTLLGVRAGAWLRAGRWRALLTFAPVALAAGWAWSLVLPFNKNLWTSSYALWTAGWAATALLAAHVLIDRRGWPALGRSFGINAIAAYAGSALMLYVLTAPGWWEAAYRRGIASWLAPVAGPEAASLAFALAVVALWWAIVALMARRGIVIRI
ncbi:acyltransferase family protein [Coralloluteibacterium stylophorae]|uniref:DUF5009 domain-containing protein n=1 Tax=Coralloluteibacterium stylophorae TaxID=1776034 RepID=A0A8J8AXW4_9GAMM|nr:heparan-alpha-glucosaminide N-acetyltransferase domain-containing protein [Coralloluteibacterium stylophorae]MBS7456225.1 DUF5009 domain-containing protein [Coralloluteibacterium stylophorae]